MLNDKIDAFQAVLKSEISGSVSNRHIRGWFLITEECIVTGFIKLLAWPNSQFGNWNHKAFSYCAGGGEQQSEKAHLEFHTFYAFVKLSGGSCRYFQNPTSQQQKSASVPAGVCSHTAV